MGAFVPCKVLMHSLFLEVCMSNQANRFKSFDFNSMFWKPFNDSTQGLWVEIATRFLGGSFGYAAMHTGKPTDCPFVENHGSSQGKKKMRTKSNFAQTGNFLCSCHPRSFIDTIDAMIATGNYRTRFDAACAITAAFGLTDVRMPRKAHTQKAISPEEQAHYENVRKEKLAQQKLNQEKQQANNKRYLQHVWDNLVSTDITRAATLYIKRRNLDVNLFTCPNQEDIRFGALNFIPPDGRPKYETQAMVAKLRCQKTLIPVALHRTYFDENGLPLKEKGETIYKKCTAILGDTWPVLTVVRKPSPTDFMLHVGEGLETIAAVGSIVAQGGVVSTMNDDGLAKFTVPDLWKDQITTVCIWADHDKETQAGMNAALTAANKLQFEGYKVIVFYPNSVESIDWQDIVSQQKLVYLEPETRRKLLLENATKATFEPIVALDDNEDNVKPVRFTAAA